jgi:hypothetical protein
MGLKTGDDAVKSAQKFLEKAKKCPSCHRRFDGFFIGRVPKKTKEEFKKWADEELASDYGMGLKWLWDFYTGVLLTGSERAEAKADEALVQVAEMKTQPQKEENVIKNVNGQIIGKR